MVPQDRRLVWTACRSCDFRISGESVGHDEGLENEILSGAQKHQAEYPGHRMSLLKYETLPDEEADGARP